MDSAMSDALFVQNVSIVHFLAKVSNFIEKGVCHASF